MPVRGWWRAVALVQALLSVGVVVGMVWAWSDPAALRPGDLPWPAVLVLGGVVSACCCGGGCGPPVPPPGAGWRCSVANGSPATSWRGSTAAWASRSTTCSPTTGARARHSSKPRDKL